MALSGKFFSPHYLKNANGGTVIVFASLKLRVLLPCVFLSIFCSNFKVVSGVHFLKVYGFAAFSNFERESYG